METYNEHIDQEIARMLETSSISPLLKAIVKASLHSMPYENKLSVLRSLQNEQRKLLILKKKEEKVVEKYRGMMENLSKDGNLGIRPDLTDFPVLL
ncbi:MAG: hypothetical protein WC285_03070 [Candidatus Gracilibacteria bacterium]